MKNTEIRKVLALFGILFFIIAACNKDEKEEETSSNLTTPCPETPTVTDSDGNVYNTVLIGNQCWMKENLKTGTIINNENEMEDNNVIEKYCYDNNPINCEAYGGLYQWNEVMQYSNTEGAQGICPTGWHVPTHDEWTKLTDFIGGTNHPNARILKSCRQVNSPYGEGCNTSEHPRWESSTHNGTDNYGFSGLPGGYINFGSFSSIGSVSSWWVSTEFSPTNSRIRGLTNGNSEIFVTGSYEKISAHSVRCLKD